MDAAQTGGRFIDGLIDDSDIFSIRVNPLRPELLFASACSGIYRSENGGELLDQAAGHPGNAPAHAHHSRRTHGLGHDLSRALHSDCSNRRTGKTLAASNAPNR